MKRTAVSLSSSPTYREALERLTLRGLREQWSASSIDWSEPIRAPRDARPRAYVDWVSQLYHLEEASIEVLGRLLDET
ncbi:MAG TPA: hypothetical protein VGL13_12745, partial [Polyangiaceae bacterium]